MPRKPQPEPWETELRQWARAVAVQSPERRERTQVAEILRRIISDPGFPNGRNELNFDSFVRLTELPSLPATVISLSMKDGRALQRLSELPLVLDKLDLSGCRVLSHLPPLPPLLKELVLKNCFALTHVPVLPASLTRLDLEACFTLTVVPALPAGLTQLNLRRCNALTVLPPLPAGVTFLNLAGNGSLLHLPALPAVLMQLNLSGCGNLLSLPPLPLVLTHLELSGCGLLTALPPLPLGLTHLDLSGCGRLTALPPLPLGLTQLDLSYCASLTELPPLPPRLYRLMLRDCRALTSLPAVPESVQLLELTGCHALTSLSRVPDHLLELDLSGARALTRLPPLPRLYRLKLNGCSSLTRLPDLPESLDSLYLQGCGALTRLPALPKQLHTLDLTGCAALTTLPQLPPRLLRLEFSNATALQSLPDLSNSALTHLTIRGAATLRAIDSLPANLTSLVLSDCSALTSLAALPSGLSRLELQGCAALIALPTLPAGLSVIKLNGCTSLTHLPNLPARRRSTVDLSGCTGLTELPRLPSYLLELNLSGCTGLTALPTLPRLMTELNLSGCSALTALPAQMPTNLRVLDLRGCTALGPLPAWVNQVAHLIRQNGQGGLGGQVLPPLERWYLRAGKNDAERAQLSLDWATLRAEAGSAGFESLLRRLSELSGREGGQLVAPQAVAAVIDELLQQDPDSRASIFAASAEAEENCHDRPLTVFNDIQGLAEAGRLLRTQAGEGAILVLAGAMYRQELLDRVVEPLMRRQWREGRRTANAAGDGPNVEEALELRLGLRQQLGDKLGLPFAARGLYTNRAMTGLNASDLVFAQAEVERQFADPQARAQALVERSLWRQYLERRDASELSALKNGFQAPMDALFEQSRNGELSSQEYTTRVNRMMAEQQAAVDQFLLDKTVSLLSNAPAESTESFDNDGREFAVKRPRLEPPGSPQPGSSRQQSLLPWYEVRDTLAPAFAEQGRALGATVRHAPQAIWLDRDSIEVRRGRCAGLALAWAHEPQSPTLLDNLFSAAAQSEDPASIQFRLDIDHLPLGGASSGALDGIGSWAQAIDHLASGTDRRGLLIDVGNHRVALAAMGAGAATRYAFFDPNAGVWSDVDNPAHLRFALEAHFTVELRRHYAWDGHLRVFAVTVPTDAVTREALQRVSQPLLSQGQQLAQQDQRLGPVVVGATRVTRQELVLLGASLAGQPLCADSDWSRPDLIRLPKPGADSDVTTPGGRTLGRGARAMLVSGSGLRLYGAYRNLSGAVEQFSLGQGSAAAIDLGGFAAEWVGEATERGVARLGLLLQRGMTRAVAGVGTGVLALGRVLARGAGVIGNLLTLPFDLYSAITQFSRARTLQGLERQDAQVGGSLASIGAGGGLLLAIAAAAGASGAALGPIGLAFGAALLAAGQIYSAVRQVQEVKQWVALSAGEEVTLGMRAFFGIELGRDVECRVEQAKYAELLQQHAARVLASDDGPPLAALLYPTARAEVRSLSRMAAHEHAHAHLLVVPDSQGESLVVAHGEIGPVANPSPTRHPGYEIFVAASDDVVDARQHSAGVQRALRDPYQAERNAQGDLLFRLGAARALDARRNHLQGSSGNDSVLIEPGLLAEADRGYLIDLQAGTLARLRRDGAQPPLGSLSDIENLYQHPGAGPSQHQLYGDARANLLVGAGRDQLVGRGGDDTLFLSGSASADGGAGDDLYLIDRLEAGQHVTLEDSGDRAEGEHSLVYFAMNGQQLSAARLVGQVLVLRFASGASLSLRGLYTPAADDSWHLRPARWTLLSQDGQAFDFQLPATVWTGSEQNISANISQQPALLAELFARPGVQTLRRLQRESEQTVMFNFGDGNDVLRGESQRKNLFILGAGNKTVQGGARDDVLSLNATPDFGTSGDAAQDRVSRLAQAQALGAYRYDLEGSAGRDSLHLETRMVDAPYRGYRIDLARGSLELIARNIGPDAALGRIHGIENLLVGDGARAPETQHQLLGDDQANVLVGSGLDLLDGRAGDDVLRASGQARALGGAGNDSIQLAGNARADGGEGNDIYLVEPLGAGEHVSIRDSGRHPGEHNLIRLNVPLARINDWRLRQNNLVLTMVSGGSLTVHDLYHVVNGQRQLGPVNWTWLTQDGFALQPELAATLEESAEPLAVRVAAQYVASADPGDAGRGLRIDLERRTLAIASTEDVRALSPDYRLIADGSEHSDWLSGAQTRGAFNWLRGRAGDDILVANAPGTLMRGDQGADRYQVTLGDNAAEVCYIDNQADDGVVDTLEVRTTVPRARWTLARINDDLSLNTRGASSEAAPVPRVLLRDYYLDPVQRHLALELSAPEGGVGARISASELAQWALDPDTERWPAPAEYTAALERLIHASASFGAERGVGSSNPPLALAPSPSMLLAGA